MGKFIFTKENVKSLRQDTGLTQQRAAESIQLKSSASWRDWESGKYNMSKGTVEYFCLKNGIDFAGVLIKSGNTI